MGEQAQKSARSSKTMAAQIANPLWHAVTNELVVDTSERHGLGQDAVMARTEVQMYMDCLADNVKNHFVEE